MSLFRNESPNLGPVTTVNEVGASATSTVTLVTSNFKPTTREVLSVTLQAAAPVVQYIYTAPWSCQVVGIRYNCTTAAGAGVLSVEKIVGDSVAPAAANGTTIVLLTATTATLSGFTANTRQNLALSATPTALLLNAGDQIAYFLSTAATSLVGGILQIEVAQIG